VSPEFPNKHHYIPVFYLKQWTGADRRLCEYSRPYNVVKPKRTYPDATGYARDLYTVASLPPEMAQIVEKTFMKTTDDFASQAMRAMLQVPSSPDLSVEIKSGWSRFILSLLMRNPQFLRNLRVQLRAKQAIQIAELRPTYDSWKLPDDPPTFEEFLAKMEPAALDKAGAILLQDVIDHRRLGAHINGMQWMVLQLHNPPHTLLTSDRPVVMSNGIGHSDAFILLPMTPVQLFLAVNTENTFRRIDALLNTGQFLGFMNNAMVRQARKYVYGQTDSQLRFVENRLTRFPNDTSRQLTWTLG
jgi:hypothetical protein